MSGRSRATSRSQIRRRCSGIRRDPRRSANAAIRRVRRHAFRHAHRHMRWTCTACRWRVRAGVVILSTSTSILAQWTCRRRCRYRSGYGGTAAAFDEIVNTRPMLCADMCFDMCVDMYIGMPIHMSTRMSPHRRYRSLPETRRWSKDLPRKK